MSETTLTVVEQGNTWQIGLVPEGNVIGRASGCEVLIDIKDISRRHARIFRDPAGAWRIEDLGSSNGVFVNGERVESSPVALGDVIEIGHASLALGRMLEHHTMIPASGQIPRIIVEDFGTEVFYDRPRLDECDARPCPERLDQISRCLSQSKALPTLYPELCQILAQGPDAAALILELPSSSSSPNVIAYHFSHSLLTSLAKGGRRGSSRVRALRVSHRLVDRVRQQGVPLMSKSIFTCDTQVTNALINEHSPRATICVPIDRTGQTQEVIYLDVAIEDRVPPGPEEGFAFVQAVAQQISHRAT